VVLLPTRTMVGLIFLVMAVFTLWQSKSAEKNSNN
jgi:hypothetical protein